MLISFNDLIAELRSRENDGKIKILIIGHGGHGKDTLAKMISKFTGYSWCSCSEFIAERAVFPLVSDLYSDWRTAHADRRNNRELWFHAVRAWNLRPGPSVVEKILTQYDICVGMRSRAELKRSWHLFDLIIWVDQSLSYPRESENSMELRAEDADVIIINNHASREVATEPNI